MMNSPFKTDTVRLALRLSASASLLALLCGGAPALAQNAEEAAESDIIIVTATKRDANLQDIPFSINAQTAADIQKSGATTLEDLSRNVAGLAIQNLGPGQSQVSIRGVSAGQIVRDQPGVKEQVGIYLDESVISLSLFTPDLDLFDLNRVETLRGPQGTLFGSGSIGGTIRYITNQPKLGVTEGVVEANANLVDGDDFGGHVKAAVNLPVGEKVAVRAVGYYTRYGGFIDAITPNGIREDINDGERYGGRLAVTFEPSDTVSITPRVVYQRIETDGFNRQELFNLYANPFTTTRPAVTFDERQQFLLLQEAFVDETLIADATIKIGIGNVDLTSISSYSDRDILVSRDASALTGSVSVDLGFPTAGVLLPSNLRDTTDLETISQEIRLSSSGTAPFQWVVGGFYSNVDRFYRQRLPTPGYDAFTDARFGAGTSAGAANGFPLNSPFNSDLPYDIDQYALFGEGSYEFDKLTLTAGARYYDFEEVRSFKTGGLFSNGDNQTAKTKSNGVTPRFLASYQLSDNATLNIQAAKGFRLGGVNDPLNIPLCSGGATGVDALTFGNRPRYKDETLWNYEVGLKTRTNGITVNGAVFYADIKNLQVTADAGSCSSRVVFNVPKAHTAGVEFEVSGKVSKSLTLGVSGSYIDSQFDSDVRTAAGAVITGIRDGNRLPSTPRIQVSANANYDFKVGGNDGFLSASVQHVGSRFTQPGDQENTPRSFVSNLAFGGAPGTNATVVNLKLPDYELVNLSAGIDFQRGLSFSVYVNNVFDENPLLAFDRERGGRARLGFSVGQPRTFGITARQKF
jgi:iron complex outermembrane recepter protein